MNKFFFRLLILSITLFWLLPAGSQNIYNLVPNYSFENFISCSGGNIDNAPPWFSPVFYSTYSSNYGNSCNPNPCWQVPIYDGCYEYQVPKSGNAYVTMYFFNNNPLSNKRNYSSVQLSTSLIAGKCYYTEFFVVQYNTANYSVNNFGLLYSDTIVKQPNNGTYINANPQILNYTNSIIKDTLNWTKVAGIYIAHGGEKFITIGNFKDDDNTDTINTNVSGAFQRGAYYLDDVSVIPIALDTFVLRADAGPDTTVTIGDSVFIGTLLGGTLSATWYNSAGQPIATDVPGLYVSPLQNTYYVLQQTTCGITTTDSVYVTVSALPLKLLTFTVKKIASSLSAGESRGEALLQWTTAQEINVDRFEIERAASLTPQRRELEFAAVGLVPTKALNGNNTTTLSYHYTDEPPAGGRGNLFYRLKMIDKDGKFTYSPIRMVENNEGAGITITPNPAPNGAITVTFSGRARGNKSIVVTDMFGRIVLQQANVNNQSITLQIKGAPGIYMVTTTDGASGKRETQKVIVQ